MKSPDYMSGMATLPSRIGSLILALIIPLSTSAYSFRQFYLDTGTSTQDEEENVEESEDVQEQLWDSECREELGIPGGDPLGAVLFNLRRCINDKRREATKIRTRSQASVRTTQYLNVRTQSTTATRFQNTEHFTRRTLKQQIELKRSFYRNFPQTSATQQQSFERARSQRRILIQEKEQSIQREEKKLSSYVSEARKACQGTKATERSNCIKDKIEELKGADKE